MKINPAHFQLAFTLPFDEAVTYLQSKGYVITKSWKDLAARAHNRAFTVSGVMRLEILEAMKENLRDSLGKGEKLPKWRDAIKQRMRELGSSPLSDARLNNIYRTNTLTAYNAGRAQRQEEVIDKRPYFLVNFVPDNRQSPICKKLQSEIGGYVIHKDHPRRRELTPPFHYQCRDTVSSLDAKTVERRGLKILDNDKGIEWEPAEGFDASPLEDYTPDVSDKTKELQDKYREFLEQRRDTLDERLRARGIEV